MPPRSSTRSRASKAADKTDSSVKSSVKLDTPLVMDSDPLAGSADVLTGTVVATDHQATRKEAEERVEAIKAGFVDALAARNNFGTLIATAARNRDHVALGYDDGPDGWNEYFSANFSELPRLDRASRQELVMMLDDTKLFSQQQLALAAGVSQPTVSNMLRVYRELEAGGVVDIETDDTDIHSNNGTPAAVDADLLVMRPRQSEDDGSTPETEPSVVIPDPPSPAVFDRGSRAWVCSEPLKDKRKGPKGPIPKCGLHLTWDGSEYQHPEGGHLTKTEIAEQAGKAVSQQRSLSVVPDPDADGGVPASSAKPQKFAPALRDAETACEAVIEAITGKNQGKNAVRMLEGMAQRAQTIVESFE